MSIILKTESFMSFFLLAILYHKMGGVWSTYLKFFLLPDATLLLFLVNPKLGSVIYNMAHCMILPLAMMAVAAYTEADMKFNLIGMIWLSHIFLDRAMGYGLKFFGSFRKTHLGVIGESPSKK